MSNSLAWALRALAMTLAGVALLGAGGARGQDAASSPESVKAAFLYHFAGYVEWPAGTDDSGPIVIAVIGADEIARELAGLLPGRSIGKRSVSLRMLQPGDDLAGVDVLFMGRATRNVPRVLRTAHRLPILLVTDTHNALDHGSMINFVRMDDRIRFEISESAAKAAGLKLSSRLLAVATRVKSSGLLINVVPPLVADVWRATSMATRLVPDAPGTSSPFGRHCSIPGCRVG